MEIKEFQPIMNKAEQIKYSKRKKLIGKLFVIAVGINEYRLKGDNLNNCCTDAKVIFHTLKSKEYFRMDDNSVLITSDTCNTEKQNILESIKACDEFIDEKTNIIFYYSGHGCNIDDTFHFWVSDSESSVKNVISINEVTDILSGMNKGRYKSITILIDACQQQISHSKGLEKQSPKFLDEYIDDAKGLGIIYSCSKGEYSLDEFNGHSISVFTYLIVQALNGHIDAVNANFLTFNKMYEFLQLNSRKISRENIQINQHPQYFFSGKDIVYAYIPNDFLQDKDIEIEIPTYDDTFMNIMFDLQNVTALLYYEKCLIVESCDGANEENPSEKFIREVCEELSRNEILQEYQYSEILSKAFTYLNLIHLNSTESLPASLKIQMIDDVMMLYNELDTIYERCVDRKS